VIKIILFKIWKFVDETKFSYFSIDFIWLLNIFLMAKKFLF